MSRKAAVSWKSISDDALSTAHYLYGRSDIAVSSSGVVAWRRHPSTAWQGYTAEASHRTAATLRELGEAGWAELDGSPAPSPGPDGSRGPWEAARLTAEGVHGVLDWMAQR